MFISVRDRLLTLAPSDLPPAVEREGIQECLNDPHAAALIAYYQKYFRGVACALKSRIDVYKIKSKVVFVKPVKFYY